MPALKRINQDDLRTHNLSVVLSAMLRSTQQLSRADLAKETNLTKATMSLLTALLLDNGIIQEGKPSAQPVYGRPSTPLTIRGGAMCGIGIQINTDGYGYLVLDLDGSIIAERWIGADLQHADADEIFGQLDAMLLEQEKTLSSRGYAIAGAGLALPGLVTESRQLLVARNLGWESLDLNAFDVVRRLDVMAANEANMAAIAQLPGYASMRQGESQVDPDGSFLYLSTDIGIGGAIVRDGKVVLGDHGFAGEIGHLSVGMNGPVCRCGRRGCLEVYAGRRSMVEAAGIATGDEAASEAALEELLSRWAAQDPSVVDVVTTGFDAIASALVSTINVADIATVIVGGLWSRLDDEQLVDLCRELQAHMLPRAAVEARVLRARDATRPALLGAAEVGLRRFVDDPLRYLRQR